jgi:hypothetical protein
MRGQHGGGATERAGEEGNGARAVKEATADLMTARGCMWDARRPGVVQCPSVGSQDASRCVMQGLLDEDSWAAAMPAACIRCPVAGRGHIEAH